MKEMNFSINYEACLPDLIDAFTQAFGEQYREIIAERLGKTKIINYYTNQHLSKYLGINIPDVKVTTEVLKKANIFFMEEMSKRYPNNEFFKTNTVFPIILRNIGLDFNYKVSVLNDLGYVEVPNGWGLLSLTEKKKFEEKINSEWDKHFSGVSISDLRKASNMAYEIINRELIMQSGNVSECIALGKSFNLTPDLELIEELICDSKIKYCTYRFDKNTKQLVPVVVNPILFLNNSEALISLIHEIVHAIGLENEEISDGIFEVKRGLEKSTYSEKDDEETICEDSYRYTGEAYVQWVATKITQILLAQDDFVERFFNFQLPEQKADPYSSYPNCIKVCEGGFEKCSELFAAAHLTGSGFRRISDRLELLEPIVAKSYLTPEVELRHIGEEVNAIIEEVSK